MNLELQALENNGTCEIIELPKGRKAIGYKWLFKTKFKANDSVERYKARLVVLGNKQKYDLDY